MPKPSFDFSGWVTKNDIVCQDGITIKHNAFKDNDGQTVPLVWNHDHSSPDNVIGLVQLENRDEGVYGYGSFNATPAGENAKELVAHGDIEAMSIFARKLQSKGKDLIHGAIKEVSLVLAGANPGALIDFVNIQHSEDGEEYSDEAIINIPYLIHAAGDEASSAASDAGEKTVQEVFDTLNDEQQAMVGTLVEGILAGVQDGNNNAVAHSGTDEEENLVKTNVFNNTNTGVEEETLSHADIGEIIGEAVKNKASLKDTFLAHGVEHLEILFPEAKAVDKVPQIYGLINTATEVILNGVRKVPFQKVKMVYADLTADEARARGYIKGEQKIEQVYPLLKRETGPQTIYKLQKLDRDDIIDVEDYDVVAFTNKELREKLNEEIARAILVGDGREVSDKYKINAEKIRPIATDDDFYTIKKSTDSADKVLELLIKAKGEYRGSGGATLFIQPELLADIKLVRVADGRYLFGDIPTNEAIAAKIGVSRIVESTFFGDTQCGIIVNLGDYTVGAAKGGQVTTFDDFDIDFNKYTYLIETRLSGALTKPKSAIYFEVKKA